MGSKFTTAAVLFLSFSSMVAVQAQGDQRDGPERKEKSRPPEQKQEQPPRAQQPQPSPAQPKPQPGRSGVHPPPQQPAPRVQDSQRQQQKQTQRAEQPQKRQEPTQSGTHPAPQQQTLPQRAQQPRQQPQQSPQQRPQQRQEPQRAQQNRQPPQQRSQQQARAWQQQKGWLQQGSWQGHATWQQNRARNWASDHRTWSQRGGYGGFYIPQASFGLYFGSQHYFRIHTRPVIYQGYPRFDYGGYSFLMLDPWPEYWSDNWYDSDDLYIDYYDDGYYLFDRRDPRVMLAVTIVL